MANAVHVLVVDDDADVRGLLAAVLESDAGATVTEAASGAEGMALLGREEFDVAVVDVQMPDHSGLDVLRWARAAEIDTELIVLTANADVETAVQAMRLGAYDFIPKPCKNAELREVVAKAAEKKALRRENSALKEVVNRRDGLPTIVGQSQEIRDLLALITRVAASDSPVLVHGESGTGKELVARTIHERSGRRAGPFVAVNCAALPETLLESELFGYEKGAFTGAAGRKEGRFELASGGTLFLDEVADLSLVTQPKILRVLQEGEFERLGGTRTLQVDVRIVAATNQDLADMVKEKRFREDLYYRLNVITIRVPPLRERHEDIRLLAQYYVRVYGAKNGRTLEGFTAEAIDRLESYAWPGNVRELENLVERSVILARKDRIDAEDLPEEIMGVKRPPRDAILELVGTPLEEVEQRLLDETLRITGGNKTQAAKLLGIDVRTVARKLERREEDLAEGGEGS
jgi:two-component system response regulator HydG